MEWAYGLTLECWQYFSSALLDIMSLDFAYLKSHVPVISDIMQVILAAGWALLIGNLVFQAVKSMASGLGFDGEDPKLLFARTFVFAFLLLASPQICEMGLDLTSRIMDALEIPDAVNVTLVDESVFGSLTAAWLLVIICGIIIMFKVFRLILEIAERYVILAMLTICAPLAFAMGGSKSTSEIFTGWCRMFGSMCVVMATNVIFFKMLLSVLSTVPSGLDVLPWMVLVMTIAKVARKADAIVTRIGLNPAITGDSLGVRFPGALTYMVVRTMTSQAAKTIGKSAGGSGRGASPNTPPSGSGGGPRNGGPFGGRNSAAAGAAAHTQQSSQQSASQQTSNQQGAAQQSSTQQSSTSQSGTQQTTTREQTAGAAVNASSQVNHSGASGGQSRKSAVPPGTRRSPSHVKSTAASAPGSPMAGHPGAGARQQPAEGVQRSAAVSQTTVRQETASHMRDASGRPAGSQPGTAGTGVQNGASAKPAAVRPGMAGPTLHAGGSQRPGVSTPATHGGVPGRPGASKSGTAGIPPHTGGSERPGAARPGTAGTGAGSTTRFTQTAAQTVHGGATSGSVQAAEQNNISVGRQHNTAAAGTSGQPVASPGPPTSHVPSGPSTQGTQAGQGETRFTHRETTRQTGQTGAATVSPIAKTPPAPAAGQPGTAGTGAAQFSQRPVTETRHGRNAPPVNGAAPVHREAPGPARQEAGKTSGTVPPPVQGNISRAHPGTAGTAATGQQASQTRQMARGSAMRAKSTPMAADSLGGKRAASSATAAAKGHLTPKGGPAPTKAADRPTRQKRGSEHGK